MITERAMIWSYMDKIMLWEIQSSRLGETVSNEEEGNFKNGVDIVWANSGKSRYQQRNFGRDSLSSLLFVLCMIPATCCSWLTLKLFLEIQWATWQSCTDSQHI